MPLELLLILVIGGIAAIALALHVLGLTSPLRLTDAGDAIAAWQREFPDSTPLKATLSHSGRAALIETNEGLGLVWVMGADTTARYLDRATLKEQVSDLLVTLPDYSAPRIRLRLSLGEMPQWKRLMLKEGLTWEPN